jgi:hypothetical protein
MGHFLCNVRSFRLISGGVSLGVYSWHSTTILDVSTLRAVFTDDESKSKCHRMLVRLWMIGPPSAAQDTRV